MNEKENQEEQRLKLLVPSTPVEITGKACCEAAAAEIAICHGPMPVIALDKNSSQSAPDKNNNVQVGDVGAEISKVPSEQVFFSNTIVPAVGSKQETEEHRAALKLQQARMDEEAAGVVELRR